ncbi:hypothetical protein L1049_023664 [Liquidambar formosana]|uniref:Uncharacterized protein n=1 Tax=Liquidambar formosana TaxID=63359 RepID=A0AAP0RYK1_LIQFO
MALFDHEFQSHPPQYDVVFLHQSTKSKFDSVSYGSLGYITSNQYSKASNLNIGSMTTANPKDVTVLLHLSNGQNERSFPSKPEGRISGRAASGPKLIQFGLAGFCLSEFLSGRSFWSAMELGLALLLRAAWIAGTLPILLASIPSSLLSSFHGILLGFARRGKIMPSSSRHAREMKSFNYHNFLGASLVVLGKSNGSIYFA